MQAASEFGNSEHSVTNIPGLPGRSLHGRLPDSVSPGLFLLQRAIWVNEHREESSAEPAQPRFPGPANTRGFDGCRE